MRLALRQVAPPWTQRAGLELKAPREMGSGEEAPSRKREAASAQTGTRRETEVMELGVWSQKQTQAGTGTKGTQKGPEESDGESGGPLGPAARPACLESPTPSQKPYFPPKPQGASEKAPKAPRASLRSLGLSGLRGEMLGAAPSGSHLLGPPTLLTSGAQSGLLSSFRAALPSACREAERRWAEASDEGGREGTTCCSATVPQPLP